MDSNPNKPKAADNTVGKQRGRSFKAGQSGNPAGRPKGSRNNATLAAEALLEGEFGGDNSQTVGKGKRRRFDRAAALSCPADAAKARPLGVPRLARASAFRIVWPAKCSG